MAENIPASELVRLFERMHREKWAYGTASRTGLVDCSGAFVWAYRQFGKSVYHGSNRIARRYVERLIPLPSASVVPGMAAFKSKRPAEKGYALPASYKQGGAHFNGDLLDHHHIGLVAADGAHVLNAKGRAYGFVSSPLDEGWDYAAFLTDVNYDTQEELPMETLIVATGGGSLNLRKAAAENSAVLTRIPNGAAVSLLERTTAAMWRVRYDGRTGYAASRYLIHDGAGITLSLARDAAQTLYDALAKALGGE